MQITKSQYITAKQCPKALWLQKNKPEILETDEKLEGILDNGKIVGQYARKLFPNGILVELDKAVETTQKLINQGVPIIYEAAFATKDMLAICDILHRMQNGWEIYEVKSSTEVKPEHIQDTAFQYYLLTKLGMDIDKVHIVYINNEYERNGELELEELFKIDDVTDEVKGLVENIAGELDEIISMLESREEPEIEIGEYCMKPHECPCKGYCWSHISEYSIFNIARMKNSKKFEIYRQGIITYEEISASNIKIALSAQTQIHSQLTGEEILNKEEIRKFLNTISFSLYFLDFETFQQPIPMFDGLKPYEQIPFQYSLHYLENADGELKHKEFLAKEGTDPRRELAKRLVNDIPDNACVIAYNMQFEKMVIKRLAEQFEDLHEHLMSIHDNMVDLMVPFQKKHYYMKEMQGSYSIKYVLPALFPEDDELDYKRLNIQNGGTAMQMFAGLHLRDAKEIEQIRKDLLEYCKLDTLAMVRIWEKLRGIVDIY